LNLKYKDRIKIKDILNFFFEEKDILNSPVDRLDTIKLLLALAAQNGWVLHQMDVKSAFFNGYLEEEIFVEQP